MPEQKSDELLLEQWVEPAVEISPLTRKNQAAIFGIAIGLAALFIVLGWWVKEFSFYLAAVGVVIGGFALNAQGKKTEISQEVVLTTQRLLVGSNSFNLEDLAGFWMEHSDNRLMINIEKKKRTLLPITIAYSSESHTKAQELFTQVLPELEAPQSREGSSISKYFRF